MGIDGERRAIRSSCLVAIGARGIACAIILLQDLWRTTKSAHQGNCDPVWSKLFLERVLVSYDIAYGLKFVGLRYFNAAGATQTLGELHEPETHLIPCVLQTASGKRKNVSVLCSAYSTPDGTAIRDYVHVSDLADAHVRALDYLPSGPPLRIFQLSQRAWAFCFGSHRMCSAGDGQADLNGDRGPSSRRSRPLGCRRVQSAENLGMDSKAVRPGHDYSYRMEFSSWSSKRLRSEVTSL
jgi:nucleoside-diphosphate-sugar epimerase